MRCSSGGRRSPAPVLLAHAAAAGRCRPRDAAPLLPPLFCCFRRRRTRPRAIAAGSGGGMHADAQREQKTSIVLPPLRAAAHTDRIITAAAESPSFPQGDATARQKRLLRSPSIVVSRSRRQLRLRRAPGTMCSSSHPRFPREHLRRKLDEDVSPRPRLRTSAGTPGASHDPSHSMTVCTVRASGTEEGRRAPGPLWARNTR